MLHVSDVRDKWNSWLAYLTFDWRHIMETAVEHNNQACLFKTFLHRLFYKIYIKISQTMIEICKKKV